MGINVHKVAYGNTGTMIKNETRTISLDFTPDFVCIAKPLTSEKSTCFCAIKCNVNSEAIKGLEYAPNMNWFVINRDTYSNSYGSCANITIAEKEIYIQDYGYGSNNVFWIAVKIWI